MHMPEAARRQLSIDWLNCRSGQRDCPQTLANKVRYFKFTKAEMSCNFMNSRVVSL